MTYIRQSIRPIEDRQGQTMALDFGLKFLNRFKMFFFFIGSGARSPDQALSSIVE